MTDHFSNPRYPILLKEIDLIHDTIKNLDDILYKTKNFAILIWGGSLYLITEHVEVEGAIAGVSKKDFLIYLTIIIPLIFWAIHYRWQMHLSMCSARERMISWFINSSGFPLWLNGEESVKFPVYDFTARLYNKQADRRDWERLGVEADEAYLIDLGHKELNSWKILFYKDAKWYYLLMMVISILFGVLRDS